MTRVQRRCRLCHRRRKRAASGVCVPTCEIAPAKIPVRRCRECGRLRRLKFMACGRDGVWRCATACDAVPMAPEVPQGTPEKRCRRCRGVFPLIPFYWAKLTRTRWQTNCKACRNERRQELYRGAPRAKPWHAPQVEIGEVTA